MRSRTPGAEALKVVEARLDLRPEEADDGHLVAAPEAPADLGRVRVDAMGELVENRQRPDIVGGAEDVPGERELGEEVGLDARGPLRGRATDVGDRVKRIDVGKYDGLHL